MNEKIIQSIIQMLQGKYKIIKSYDVTEDMDLNGILAVNIDSVERLNHGNYKDSKFSISINGQTLSDEDKNRTIINQMFDYVFDNFDQNILKNKIDGLVGVVVGNSSITSDGQSNNFSFGADLYICID